MRLVSITVMALLMCLVVAAMPLYAEDLGANLLSTGSSADNIYSREEVQKRSQP